MIIDNPKHDMLMRKYDPSCYLDFAHYLIRKQYCLESVLYDKKLRKAGLK